ncbi:MAG: hypothetical protein VX542_04670, partial [Cyanobacteriota bacterium]|nr:hypothetical protein [Cyanobacteriota bacterium]
MVFGSILGAVLWFAPRFAWWPKGAAHHWFWWEGLHLKIVLDLGHELLPGPRSITTAARCLSVVVVAEPY